jgi:hypothetical protein
MYKVHSLMKNPRVTPVSVDSDGTLLIPNRAVSVVKNSTGVYTITLNRSCQQLLFGYAVCIADGSNRHTPQIAKADITAKSLKVRTYDLTDSLADAAFDILIFGSDGGLSTFGVLPCEVKCALASPKFFPFVFNGTTSVQESKTKEFGTFAKTGTGRYTLSLRKTAFRNNFYCVAITDDPDVLVEIKNKDNSSIELELSETSGSTAADASVYVYVVGSNNSTIFNSREFPLMCPLPYVMLNPFEYIGSGTPAMVRAQQYIAGTRDGAGDYSFLFEKNYRIPGFGLAQGGGAAIIPAVNSLTNSGMTIEADGDGTVYGLDIGFRRGAPAL